LDKVKKLLLENPNNTKLHGLYAKILYDEGMHSEAENYILNKSEAFPNDEILKTICLEFKNNSKDTLWLKDFLKDSTLINRNFHITGYPLYLGDSYELLNRHADALYSYLYALDNGSGSYFGSYTSFKISNIYNKLGQPLLSNFFYLLYRSNLNDQSFDILSKEKNRIENISIINSTVQLNLKTADSLIVSQRFKLKFNIADSLLFFPVFVNSDASNYQLHINPDISNNFNIEEHKNFSIFYIHFKELIKKNSSIELEVRYTDKVDCSNWFIAKGIWILQGANVNIRTYGDLIVDKNGILENNDKLGITQSNGTHTLTSQTNSKIEKIFICFINKNKMQWEINLMLFIPTFYILFALICSFILLKFKLNKSVKFTLISFSILLICIYLMSFLLSSWSFVALDNLLSKIFSPELGFSQNLLSIILILFNTISIFYLGWFIFYFKNHLISVHKIENIYSLGIPIFIPILWYIINTYYIIGLNIENLGWNFICYFASFSFIISIIIALVIIRIVDKKTLVGYFIGILISIGLLILGNISKTIGLIVEIVFFISAILFVYNLWNSYKADKSQYVTDSEAILTPLSDLQNDLKIFIDKNIILIKIVIFISGTVTFISTLLSVLKNLQ
jgi:hypothetical protein